MKINGLRHEGLPDRFDHRGVQNPGLGIHPSRRGDAVHYQVYGTEVVPGSGYGLILDLLREGISIDAPGTQTVTFRSFAEGDVVVPACTARFGFRPGSLVGNPNRVGTAGVGGEDARQKLRVAEKLSKLIDLKGKRIAVLDLAYKAETDDIRESPAISIVAKLLAEGAEIHAHDLKAVPNFKKLFPNIHYHASEFGAVNDADAVLILTEWNEFRNIDLHKVRKTMRGDIIMDARNVLEPELVRSLGFNYSGTGR